MPELIIILSCGINGGCEYVLIYLIDAERVAVVNTCNDVGNLYSVAHRRPYENIDTSGGLLRLPKVNCGILCVNGSKLIVESCILYTSLKPSLES